MKSMNPFEHQNSAPKFNPNKFGPGRMSSKQEFEKSEISAKLEKLIQNKTARPFSAKYSAAQFSKLGVLQENAQLHNAFEAKRKVRANIELFEYPNNVQEIHAFLANDKLEDPEFDKEISHTKQTYGEHLSSADFLSQKDWKILTGIKIFNKEILERSIETYQKIKNKIEQEIDQEVASMEKLYRTCLFKGLGEMTVPKIVLEHQKTDAEWTFYFMELPEEQQDDFLVENKIIIPDAIRNDLEKMTNFFAKNKISPAKFMPIKTILNDKQISSFEKLELDVEKSFEEILQICQRKSREILASITGLHPTELATIEEFLEDSSQEN